MLRKTVKVEGKSLTKLQKGTRRIPTETRKFTKKLAGNVEQLAQNILGRTPGPVARPVQWTSVAQMHFVFALRRRRGLGPGDPWPRTDKLQKGWQVEVVLGTEDTVLLVLTHNSGTKQWKGEDVQIVEFVMGDYQQRYHRNTGWANVNDTTEALEIYTNDQIDNWWLGYLRSIF